MKLISFLFLLICSFIFIADVSAQQPGTVTTAAPPVNNEDAKAAKNPELRGELLKRLGTARTLREELAKKYSGIIPPSEAQAIMKTDAENKTWLQAEMGKYGWPGKSLVGDDGENAAFHLVRISIQDPEFQKHSLELLQKAIALGEAPAEQATQLADIMRQAGGMFKNSSAIAGSGPTSAPKTIIPAQPKETGSIVAAAPVKNPELREELLKRMKADQDIRAEAVNKYPVGQPLPGDLVERFKAIDRENTEWLKKVIAQNGYPGFSAVGRDGELAAFLIIQHAAHDPGFQKQSLEMIRRAVAQKDASPTSLAYLTDRLLTFEGKPQIYGTQMRVNNGKTEPFPIEDEANVDKRRAEIGLPPLADYLNTIQKRYQKPNE